MRTVVSRRHLLNGSGPFDRVSCDGDLFRLVFKKIIITYNDGGTFFVEYSVVDYKSKEAKERVESQPIA